MRRPSKLTFNKKTLKKWKRKRCRTSEATTSITLEPTKPLKVLSQNINGDEKISQDIPTTKNNDKTSTQETASPFLFVHSRRSIVTNCLESLRHLDQIPQTCYRLKKELSLFANLKQSPPTTSYTNETNNDNNADDDHDVWDYSTVTTATRTTIKRTIRDLCEEHVQLQKILIQLDSDIKSLLNSSNNNKVDEGVEVEMMIDHHFQSVDVIGDKDVDDQSPMISKYHGEKDDNCNIETKFNSRAQRDDDNDYHDEKQDLKLAEEIISRHVVTVWTLGDDIQSAILNDMAFIFEFIFDNPERLMILTQAVNVYERAAAAITTTQRRQSSNDSDSLLRVTDIKSHVIYNLRHDFCKTMSNYFDNAYARNALNSRERLSKDFQLAPLLKSLTALVHECDAIKNRMTSCFPSDWEIEIIGASCLSQLCHDCIMKYIAGDEDDENEDDHDNDVERRRRQREQHQQQQQQCQNEEFLRSSALLEKLHVIEILDIVAWLECYNTQIEGTFPNVDKMLGETRMHVYGCANLFGECDTNTKNDEGLVEADYDAMNHLTRVYHKLKEIYRLAKEEILERTMDKIDGWLDNVYCTQRTIRINTSHHPTSSLPDDVFFLVDIHLRTFLSHLPPPKSSNTVIAAATLLLTRLEIKQRLHSRRLLFHSNKINNSSNNKNDDFESCCAAANDYLIMSRKCACLFGSLHRGCDYRKIEVMRLRERAMVLIGLYEQDAIYAARLIQYFFYGSFQERRKMARRNIGGFREQLRRNYGRRVGVVLDKEGEEEALDDVGVSELIHILDDFLTEVEDSLIDRFLLTQTVGATVSATVVFYIERLLDLPNKNHPQRIGMFLLRKPFLENVDDFLSAMKSHIESMRRYFVDHWIPRTIQPVGELETIIKREFSFLEVMHEIMIMAHSSTAIDLSMANVKAKQPLCNAILFVYHRLGDIDLTKYFLIDLWFLVNRSIRKRSICDMVDSVLLLSANDSINSDDHRSDNRCYSGDKTTVDCWFGTHFDRTQVPGLKINEMMAELYFGGKRRLPRNREPLELKRIIATVKVCPCDIDNYETQTGI